MRRVARMMAFAELRGRDKGLNGASSVWLGIWVVATAYRYLQRWMQPDPVVVREVLAPGQQLVVTHYVKGDEPPEAATSRRGRRKARKRAAAEEKALERDADKAREQALDVDD